MAHGTRKVPTDPKACELRLEFVTLEAASPYIRSARTHAFKCEKCGRFHLKWLGSEVGTRSRLEAHAL